MTANEKKNTQLIALFNQLIRQDPDLLDEIPNGAVVVMQIEGDESFNEWARKIARANASKPAPKRRTMILVKFEFRTYPSPGKLSKKMLKDFELQLA